MCCWWRFSPNMARVRWLDGNSNALYICTDMLYIKNMQTVSYSEFRQNLKQYCDQVCDAHDALEVSRRNGEDLVVLPKEDYSALLETAYLLQSPANAARLMQALSEPRSQQTEFESVDALRKAFDL